MKYTPAKQIHVLHVVPGLRAGGMELALARVIAALSSDSMRHSIVCLKGDAEIADRLPIKTEVYCLHSRPNELRLPARLADLVRRIRPTVIHARNWGAWPDMAVARLLVWPIMPFVFSFHGLGEAGYMPLRRRLASHILARITTCLFTVSEPSKRLMVSKWGWPQAKVNVIPNGVNTELFRPANLPRNKERFVVGTVGILKPVKNHALLVRACDKLVRRGINLKLRIAGDGQERCKLIALARSLDFEDHLELYGHVENIPEFLGNLDVFVLCSDSEQHPNALIEAMACGLPCIGTRVGGVEDIVDTGRCGLVIDPKDESGLTEAILSLLRNPALRNKLSLAARKRICDSYSMERMRAAYDQMYRCLSGG